MNRDPLAVLALVHRYFTPFALGLVTTALVFSRPAGVYAFVSYGVLAFAALFNLLTERWSRRPGWLRTVREMRLGINLAANSFLVFLLLPYWRPIWLLFVLTPVATGVYENRRRTFQMSSGIGLLLVWAYWINGLRAPAELSQGVVYAMFILFLSLFVNRVAHEQDLPTTIKL